MYLTNIFNSNMMYVIGLVVSLFVFTFYFCKKGYKIVDGILITLLQVLFAFIFAALFASFEKQELAFVGVSYYGTIFSLWFVPLIYSKIRKLNTLEVIDIIAPVHMFMLGFMKIGCTIDGCCYGVTINGYKVPIQIIEACIGFILFALLIIFRNKIKNYSYPTILIAYGFLRFFIEFFRFHYSFEHIIGFLTRGQIWSILAFLLGIGLLFITRKKLQK